MVYREIGLLFSRSGSQQISNCSWMFFQMISSKLRYLLLPNLVWWCIFMNNVSLIVFQKDWFAVFKVKVTVKDHIIKIWGFNILSDLLILLQLNLVWWHITIKLDCLLKRLDCSVVVKVKVTLRFKMPVNVHLDDFSLTAEPSVMHDPGPEYYARRLVCCHQVQGHSDCSYNQVWLFLPYLLNCWSFCNHI